MKSKIILFVIGLSLGIFTGIKLAAWLVSFAWFIGKAVALIVVVYCLYLWLRRVFRKKPKTP